MVKHSPLDDAGNAAHAWARYRRLMRFMVGVTLVVVVVAWVLIHRQTGFVSWHLFIATGLGIGVSMMLMSALMGLVFLSSGTGHDESVENPLEDPEREQD